MPALDNILEHVREFDFFQKKPSLSYACFLFPFVSSPGVAELSQRCGWSLEEQLNHTVPEWHGHGASFSSRCRRYEVDWNTTGISCTDPLECECHTVPLGPCRDGWVCDSPGSSVVIEVRWP
uniref:Uncharacterized protein n=1 Tax=Junco hyemalis TaxID=40217 RepID=A0A8C5JD42_JUNHY